METYLQAELTISQLRKEIEKMKLYNVVSWSMAAYWNPIRDQVFYTFAMMYIPAQPVNEIDELLTRPL